MKQIAHRITDKIIVLLAGIFLTAACTEHERKELLTVEGKEASLMFARDLLRDGDPELLKNVVLLICPLLNPDGNEKISRSNRQYQNGPDEGVGVRHYGQFLDLNRDAMKAESPEVKGVITRVFNAWDPALFMDCHTTNGSYHVEPVTFTWMVF